MLLKSQTVSCNNAQVASKGLIEASNARIYLSTKKKVGKKPPGLREDYYQLSEML